MNRYLLFAGEHYSPHGGFADYIGSYNSIEQAKEELPFLNNIDWWHIVDRDTAKIVAKK